MSICFKIMFDRELIRRVDINGDILANYISPKLLDLTAESLCYYNENY